MCKMKLKFSVEVEVHEVDDFDYAGFEMNKKDLLRYLQGEQLRARDL